MSGFTIKGTKNKTYDLKEIVEESKRMNPNAPLSLEVSEDSEPGDREGTLKLINDNEEMVLEKSSIFASDKKENIDKVSKASGISSTELRDLDLPNKTLIKRKTTYEFDVRTGKYKKK